MESQHRELNGIFSSQIEGDVITTKPVSLSLENSTINMNALLQ